MQANINLKHIRSSSSFTPVHLPLIAIDKLCRVLFVFLILSSTYDKSGILIGGISISIYKLLFIVLVIWYVVDPIRSRIEHQVELDHRLLRLIVAFVLIQTTASFLGSLINYGSIRFSSEVYYIIQRSSFLFIPLIALKYKIPPKSILKLFVGAILLHHLMIALQFVFPRLYLAFVELVFDPLRPDNTFYWDMKSWAFIGLQRTGNYGSFVAAYGMLVLAFTPKRLIEYVVLLAMVLFSLLASMTGGSRSVLMMMFVTVLFFSKKTSLLKRVPIYIFAFYLVVTVVILFIKGIFDLQDLRSIYAFVDPARVGSNLGKLAIVEYTSQLFFISPIIGWGQQAFSELSGGLGNSSFFTSETHSYFITIILSSGIIGFLAYAVVFISIVRRLWRNKGRDYAIICAMFIGLGVYNLIYDASGLDFFACFHGIAAYYALLSTQNTNKRLAAITS